jgi:uncharacterized protein YjbI with pentapeptide repeats
MSQPKLLDTPLYALLHKDDITGFNKERPKDGPIDMVGGDFRGLDLRELNADGIDFTDAYFRSADLRGIDFTHPSWKAPAWPMRRFPAPTFRQN